MEIESVGSTEQQSDIDKLEAVEKFALKLVIQ